MSFQYLMGNRYNVAQQAFEDYEFGVMLDDAGSWEATEPDHATREVYGQGFRLSFHVRFKANSDEVAEAYALDMSTGNYVGFWPGPLNRATPATPNEEAM